MIPYKEYTQLKKWSEQIGLPSDKESLAKMVKVLHKYVAEVVPNHQEKMRKQQFEQMKNKIPHGYVPVNKKVLGEFLNTCAKYISDFDKLMAEPASYTRGAAMGQMLVTLNNALYAFKQYNVAYTSTLEGKSEYEAKLLKKFYEQQDELILKAAFDDTKRHNLYFIIGLHETIGGTVTYNKSKCTFTEIQYSINGCAEIIPLI